MNRHPTAMIKYAVLIPLIVLMIIGNHTKKQLQFLIAETLAALQSPKKLGSLLRNEQTFASQYPAVGKGPNCLSKSSGKGHRFGGYLYLLNTTICTLGVLTILRRHQHQK